LVSLGCRTGGVGIAEYCYELVGGDGEEQAFIQSRVGVYGGGQGGHAALCGEHPQGAGEDAVFGLGAAGSPVGGVRAAFCEQDGQAFGAAVYFDVPVVVVVGRGQASSGRMPAPQGVTLRG